MVVNTKYINLKKKKKKKRKNMYMTFTKRNKIHKEIKNQKSKIKMISQDAYPKPQTPNPRHIIY